MDLKYNEFIWFSQHTVNFNIKGMKIICFCNP